MCCPICKEKFEYMAQFSYFTLGKNLDFKPFGAATILIHKSNTGRL